MEARRLVRKEDPTMLHSEEDEGPTRIGIIGKEKREHSTRMGKLADLLISQASQSCGEKEHHPG